MRSFPPFLALLALAACSEPSERSYAVDELVADKGLLAELIQKCRNDPGTLRATANCRNAEAADGKLRLERMRRSLGG
jgi:hypothetical protein